MCFEKEYIIPATRFWIRVPGFYVSIFGKATHAHKTDAFFSTISFAGRLNEIRSSSDDVDSINTYQSFQNTNNRPRLGVVSVCLLLLLLLTNTEDSSLV